MWAIGVVIFGMATGNFPFKGEDETKTKSIKCPPNMSRDAKSFIKAALAKDEVKRLTASAALEHPFFGCKSGWLAEKKVRCEQWTAKKVDLARDVCRQAKTVDFARDVCRQVYG